MRLGLVMDGLKPFCICSTKWSTWPTILVKYKVPPQMAIKIGHLILCLLIPRKRKVKKLSVYLASLIDEI